MKAWVDQANIFTSSLSHILFARLDLAPILQAACFGCGGCACIGHNGGTRLSQPGDLMLCGPHDLIRFLQRATEAAPSCHCGWLPFLSYHLLLLRAPPYVSRAKAAASAPGSASEMPGAGSPQFTWCSEAAYSCPASCWLPCAHVYRKVCRRYATTTHSSHSSPSLAE